MVRRLYEKRPRFQTNTTKDRDIFTYNVRMAVF